MSFDRSGAFQHVKKVMDLKVMRRSISIYAQQCHFDVRQLRRNNGVRCHSGAAESAMRLSRATIDKFDA